MVISTKTLSANKQTNFPLIFVGIKCLLSLKYFNTNILFYVGGFKKKMYSEEVFKIRS